MTDLILLAAGASRRFGRQKLLEKFRGRELYRYAFDAAKELKNVRVIAVTREGLLDDAAREYGFSCVLVPPEKGVGISVAAGTGAAREEANCCFFVCDQPEMDSRTLQAFIDGFEHSGKLLGRCTAENHCGSPTVFSPTFREALLKLEEDEGGRGIFRGRETDTYYYEVEPFRLRDYDTPWEEE